MKIWIKNSKTLCEVKVKVVDHILKTKELNKGPRFSFEVVPPPRGRSVKDIIDIAEKLSTIHPQWIDVTSHASMAYYHENEDGSIHKKTYRKRPGTLGICGIIQNRFKIDTVAHVLCQGFTKEETEDALIELNYLGIHNVLALRGDTPNYQKVISKNHSVNFYASDLVAQIRELKQGKFIEDISNSSPLDFCVGVAGYPEKHFESANSKTDLQYLKTKVDAGAAYIITQMFFDNQKFFSFKKSCENVGIHVPIVPGLKIIKNMNQLKTIPKTFNVDLPEDLVDQVLNSPKDVEKIGFEWALNQVKELVKLGESSIHFYVMNDTDQVVNLVRQF